MKKFMSGARSSNDRDGDSQNGHRKTDSILSDETKGQSIGYGENEGGYMEVRLRVL